MRKVADSCFSFNEDSVVKKPFNDDFSQLSQAEKLDRFFKSQEELIPSVQQDGLTSPPNENFFFDTNQNQLVLLENENPLKNLQDFQTIEEVTVNLNQSIEVPTDCFEWMVPFSLAKLTVECLNWGVQFVQTTEFFSFSVDGSTRKKSGEIQPCDDTPQLQQSTSVAEHKKAQAASSSAQPPLQPSGGNGGDEEEENIFPLQKGHYLTLDYFFQTSDLSSEEVEYLLRNYQNNGKLIKGNTMRVIEGRDLLILQDIDNEEPFRFFLWSKSKKCFQLLSYKNVSILADKAVYLIKSQRRLLFQGWADGGTALMRYLQEMAENRARKSGSSGSGNTSLTTAETRLSSSTVKTQGSRPSRRPGKEPMIAEQLEQEEQERERRQYEAKQRAKLEAVQEAMRLQDEYERGFQLGMGFRVATLGEHLPYPRYQGGPSDPLNPHVIPKIPRISSIPAPSPTPPEEAPYKAVKETADQLQRVTQGLEMMDKSVKKLKKQVERAQQPLVQNIVEGGSAVAQAQQEAQQRQVHSEIIKTEKTKTKTSSNLLEDALRRGGGLLYALQGIGLLAFVNWFLRTRFQPGFEESNLCAGERAYLHAANGDLNEGTFGNRLNPFKPKAAELPTSSCRVNSRRVDRRSHHFLEGLERGARRYDNMGILRPQKAEALRRQFAGERAAPSVVEQHPTISVGFFATAVNVIRMVVLHQLKQANSNKEAKK